MRIIAGKHRGRPIRVPHTDAVRPSSDRLRQAVFNILDHRGGPNPYAGQSVIDVFAGTGAYGLEALSRGAAFAIFVDSDAAALRGIRRTAASMAEGGNIAVLKLDATRLVSPPRLIPEPAAVAFLDPPYRSGLAVAALQGLHASGWLREDALAVVEIAATEPLSPPRAYTLLDERTYGAGRVVILECAAATKPDAARH
ncbi:MAG: 16S rRNA (guanine(966)-N(2))-methyltransferase RsmD [Rhodospirillales bacterium]|nr:16S rRNA (guanine(966)-N(2))-methyltransferase RsmD [Rhodospirillales bacterium]